MCQPKPGLRCSGTVRKSRLAARDREIRIVTDIAVHNAERPVDGHGQPVPDPGWETRMGALQKARFRTTSDLARLDDEWSRIPAGQAEAIARNVPGTVEHAEALAERLFAEVLGKVDEPYIQHLRAVENGIPDRTDINLRIAAFLHDSIEDIDGCDRTYLLREGIPADAVDLIEAVTHPPGEPSSASIARVVNAGRRARALKRSDLSHNTQPDRNKPLARVKVARARRAALIAGTCPDTAENDAWRAVRAHASRYAAAQTELDRADRADRENRPAD